MAPAALRGRRRGAAPPLEEGDLHVWRVDVPAAGPALDAALRRLSPEERAHARRLAAPAARARFVAVRGALRTLLGAYLGRPPTRIRIVAGPHGKPALAARAGAAPLHFSVSHSGALGLLAFSVDGPIGVDLERLREVRNAAGIAARYFSPRERRTLRATSGPTRSRRFLALWTAKEAILKARGDGLAALERVEVRRQAGGLVGLDEGVQRWTIAPLSPGRGYVAAVALPSTRAPDGPTPEPGAPARRRRLRGPR